ncbi:MAG: hypothetical protein GIKADHBN_03394 [Phycisphaerales bacterium]|nr:hypothetical protein [Phycisphaerales bacterium]
MMGKRDPRQIEFGDFQTPDALAEQVVSVLKARGVKPASVVEPTCGLAAFIIAAVRGFGSARRVIGLEINADYFAKADARLLNEPRRPVVDLRLADFFSFDWPVVIRELPEPVLLLGNPPWVTSSGLGAMGGTNLPEKSNFQGHRGLDAITGKGNFDIAEWILIRLLEAASGRRATLAMLVKTSTARRVLSHAWRFKMPIERAAVYEIDAANHFDVGVSACLLVCDLGPSPGPTEADLFDLDSPTVHKGTIGYRDGALVADARAFDRLRRFIAEGDGDDALRWRSGVKHDCSAVMELRRVGDGVFLNGLGEKVRLEPDFVFPMMKGSDVASGRVRLGERWMIVPQRSTSDDTSRMCETAPRTWDYLVNHGEALDRRGSSIYRKRPRFAVFGIGPYTFSPWKVAVCGLYKRLAFATVGPMEGRPVVFDDTVYHLSFDTEAEARTVAELLNSADGREFFNAFTFWDAKRPITVDVLRRLDLRGFARACGKESCLVGRSIDTREENGLF